MMLTWSRFAHAVVATVPGLGLLLFAASSPTFAADSTSGATTAHTVSVVQDSVPGDANNDGRVGSDDFFILIDNWGKTGAGNPADFNGDGSVGFLDFFIMIDDWGK